MYYDVIRVTPLKHLIIRVWFRDGLNGEVEFKDSHLHGVFEVLKNPQIFQHVHCEHGFVSWANEIDLAPDAMYQSIKSHGRWVLE